MHNDEIQEQPRQEDGFDPRRWVAGRLAWEAMLARAREAEPKRGTSDGVVTLEDRPMVRPASKPSAPHPASAA